MKKSLYELYKSIKGLKGTELILKIGNVTQLELQWVLAKVELEKHKKLYKKASNIGSIVIERTQVNFYKSRLKELEKKLKPTFLPIPMSGAEA